MSICQVYYDNTILKYLFCIFGVFFYSPLLVKEVNCLSFSQTWMSFKTEMICVKFCRHYVCGSGKKVLKICKIYKRTDKRTKISIINLLLCWVVLFWTESCNAAYEFLLLLYLIIFCCIFCCNFAVFKLLVASCGSVYK